MSHVRAPVPASPAAGMRAAEQWQINHSFNEMTKEEK
jgi:hypothetical protein